MGACYSEAFDNMLIANICPLSKSRQICSGISQFTVVASNNYVFLST